MQTSEKTTVPFNQRFYGDLVSKVARPGSKDYKYLCNQLGRTYR